MTKEAYLKKLGKCIHDPELRTEIQKEYEIHLEDCIQALIKNGMQPLEAEQEAVRQMGDPKEAGRGMDQIYRTNVDWKMTLWFTGCTIVIGGLRVLLSFYDTENIEDPIYQKIRLAVGIFLLLWGLFWAAVERWNGKDLWYVWGNDWGGAGTGIVNSGVHLAFGIAILSVSFQVLLIMMTVVGFLQLAERFLIARAQCRKEEALLWEIGTAQTEILPYKGRAWIKGKRQKVHADTGAIPKGNPVIVVGLQGFCPVVIPLESNTEKALEECF